MFTPDKYVVLIVARRTITVISGLLVSITNKYLNNHSNERIGLRGDFLSGIITGKEVAL